MISVARLLPAILALMIAAAGIPVGACTSILVTRGASADSSVMITYTCDGEFHPTLEYRPAADYPPDDSLSIKDWSGEVRGKIAQVEHTYAVVGLMNEHQLAISETTFDGRPELQNPDGLLHYWDLMDLALQRARTAREAITEMTDLVQTYGYRSTGESFSIADTREAWILEMIGPGEGGQGAHWVAVKVPDGMISCHANKARIGEFPLDDPENCRYSNGVIAFAVEQGYYDPASGEPFRYCDAYCPSTPKNCRWADGRVWSILRRAAPAREFSPDRFRGVTGAGPYPLFVEPDKKLSLPDVFALMRDHFEGTAYDMTVGLDAGPYGCPTRSRPLQWRADSTDTLGPEYAWERAISTQQTGFSFVSQSRSHLPDKIGGVYWYGVDDTYTTCYFPLYCGITAIPESYAVGELGAFSWESAWWVFNFVANFANLRYSTMAPEILALQRKLEGRLLSMQPAVEGTAADLYRTDSALMVAYLTDYSVMHAEQVTQRWRGLAHELMTKFNDGYVKDEQGRPRQVGYPPAWYRSVIDVRGDDYRLPVDSIAAEPRLVD